ncbi:NUDIX hydrolase [Aliikangiella coralliicola]|uniref:NUDIX hydrolase n=1 Tax=Aliikangiella coralliicola TaxID=2592383 RepID=A0A545UCL6_9GAMM|nr:NUDIX hydrolase [Aliikangiella coralliicola]TQV87196.1 NUDIX hydrolase [Aliikangiella coralliicola]
MIKFDLQNNCFNFRSVAVLIVKEHILVHQAVGDDFWALPGGRVEFFENSDDTLVREMKEESGVFCQVSRPLWYVENFFEYGNKKYHEIATYYLAEIMDCHNIQFEQAFDGIESGLNLKYKWVALSRISEINLKPEFLKSRLFELPASIDFVQINEIKNEEQ